MITSKTNTQVKNIEALIKKSKERRKQNKFIVEGSKMVQEAPASWISKIYVSETYAKQNEKWIQSLKDTPWEVLSDAVFGAVSDTQTPQGILAIVDIPSYELDTLLQKENPLLLVIDSIQDPGNLGTMMRTAEGAGVTGVIMNRTTVDLFNPKTVRSTMGSIYRMPFVIVEELEQAIETMKQRGVAVYAAHLKGTQMYDAYDYTKASAFMIGNEGNGLSDSVAACADVYIRIPMEGQVESLNAAISAALLTYEANRQRRKA